MRILGIDTSCDDTSAAVVEDGVRVLSSVVSSQVDLHSRFGGIVPEICSRAHVQSLIPIVDQALQKAGVSLSSLETIAVTNAPGLVGALLVGVSVAKALAFCARLPLVAINHVEAHIFAARLMDNPPGFPYICLVASGGHTSLYLSRSEIEHEHLGSTTDDAAGEAFDKIAALLKLSYPGGPAIEKKARKGNPSAVHFPRTLLGKNSLDFSFSGIKTAVLYFMKGQDGEKRGKNVRDIQRADVAASFQEAMVDVLVDKTLRAVRRTGVKRVVLGGGVACNSRLRERMREAARKRKLALYLPPPGLCLDNAAMVAGQAFYRYRSGLVDGLTLDVLPRLVRARVPPSRNEKEIDEYE